MDRSQDPARSNTAVTSGQSATSIEALTAGQPDDVWERAGYWRANACVIAMQRDSLLEALKGADQALFHAWLSAPEGAPTRTAERKLNAARAAIAKATGAA